MEALLPAAVLEHRSVVWFPGALIRETPLRKHTCWQPMRRCPAAHTGPAYTPTHVNMLANGTHTPSAVSAVCAVWHHGANQVCEIIKAS